MKRRVGAGIANCALCLGLTMCGEATSPRPSPAPTAPLALDGVPLSLDWVARVAQTRGTTAPHAARAVIGDALFARHLQESSPAVADYVRTIGLARRMSDRLALQARALGEINDEELAVFTERHWWELDRPTTSRTTHVVVRVHEGQDAEPARNLARQLHELLRDAGTKERFRQIVETVDTAGFEVRVEDLSPVALDGRVIDLGSPPPPGTRTHRYAPAFARAASGISTVGEVSDVVQTEFGFHVLLLTERIEEKRVPPNERRSLLRQEVHDARARRLEAELLARVRAALPVAIDQSALAQTEGLSVRQ